MQTPTKRQVAPIRIIWSHVDDLMVNAGIASDAELARRANVAHSTITRARQGAASATAIQAIKRVFPDASLDDFVAVPADAA